MAISPKTRQIVRDAVKKLKATAAENHASRQALLEHRVRVVGDHKFSAASIRAAAEAKKKVIARASARYGNMESPSDDAKFPYTDKKSIDYMAGWWSSESKGDDPGGALLSIGTRSPEHPIEISIARKAVRGLSKQLQMVLPVEGGRFQLGRGTFTKKEIDELRYMRDSLLRWLVKHGATP